jgi:transcriptional regulator with XRE-family HTH domain
MAQVVPLILPPTVAVRTVLAMTTLGRRIKQIRKARGLTRPDLAEAAGVKTTPGAVYQWETGRATPTTDKLPHIAKALNVSVSDLLDDTEASVKSVTRDTPSPDSEDSTVRAIIQQALHLTPTKRRAVVEFLTRAAEVMDDLQNKDPREGGDRS